MVIKPKTYRTAIKYSTDTNWKSALRKNSNWINKYMTPGSYYGGFNWYKSKTVNQEVKNWWTKLMNLPPKQSEKEIKEFINDFPRYLFYIIIFKNVPSNDDMKKVYLLYDISRGEYGELPSSFSSSSVISGEYWGDMLDSSHNQIKAVESSGKIITFKDIYKRHGFIFSKAFSEIESDFTQEKDRMYDLLGFWSDRGGEYAKDALVFLRSNREPDRLQITKPNLLKKGEDGTISWARLGYYDDPNFDYWELDNEIPEDKKIPNDGKGFKDYYTSIRDGVEKLKDSLDKYPTSFDGIKF